MDDESLRVAVSIRAIFGGLILIGIAAACNDPTGTLSSLQIDDASGSVAWSDISVGEFSACGLSSAGRAYCWGFDESVPCDTSGCPHYSVPTAVPRAPDFVAIATGGFASCGLTANGQGYCWGRVFNSSLGDGITTQSPTPVKIQVLGQLTQVSAGYSRICALTAAGVAYCWGDNGTAIGAGPGIRGSRVPLAVTSPVPFSSISVGVTQICALSALKDAYCWGSGYGSLGIGVRDTSCALSPSCTEAFTPELVAGGLKWSDISAGNGVTCAVTVDALGYCWGDVPISGDPYGPSGLLGSGQLAGSKAPVAVSGDHRFKMIRAGTRQVCGITTAGAALCWGVNVSGQLGIGITDAGAYNIGTQVGKYASPQVVVGKLQFSRIAEGDVSCGISTSGNAYCWGGNGGGLLGGGDDTFRSVSIPSRVVAPRN